MGSVNFVTLHYAPKRSQTHARLSGVLGHHCGPFDRIRQCWLYRFLAFDGQVGLGEPLAATTAIDVIGVFGSWQRREAQANRFPETG